MTAASHLILLTTSTPPHKSIYSPSLPSLKLSITTTLRPNISKSNYRRFAIAAKSNNTDSAALPDRVISAVCYFYPFFDGVQYGKYVITQFSPIQTLIQPLVPAIRVFKSFPFNGFLVFMLLYFVVVRNSNFSRDGFGLDLMMSVDSTVFLFLLVCLIYGSSCCALGQVPRLPIVAEAADRQVP
ncbi:unnamed protein product [Rhodiola kirilowii]